MTYGVKVTWMTIWQWDVNEMNQCMAMWYNDGSPGVIVMCKLGGDVIIHDLWQPQLVISSLWDLDHCKHVLSTDVSHGTSQHSCVMQSYGAVASGRAACLLCSCVKQSCCAQVTGHVETAAMSHTIAGCNNWLTLPNCINWLSLHSWLFWCCNNWLPTELHFLTVYGNWTADTERQLIFQQLKLPCNRSNPLLYSYDWTFYITAAIPLPPIMGWYIDM